MATSCAAPVSRRRSSISLVENDESAFLAGWTTFTPEGLTRGFAFILCRLVGLCIGHSCSTEMALPESAVVGQWSESVSEYERATARCDRGGSFS